MTFISYAQNYEDVMLYRALKSVKSGFYIDVGANDPVIDSVTKAFYNIGWSGINIEPVSEYYEKLQQDRPNDINLQLAVGARKGNRKFYEVVGTGLSTIDRFIAKRHSEEHGYEIKTYQVEMVRLNTICAMHPQPDVHFLKIDVEGAEKQVLQGLNLSKIRPWIILIESTLPNLQTQDFDQWEHFITERNYHFVYFDGLNRFYIANEHSDLDPAFLTPPNVFDSYIRLNEIKLEQQAQNLESRNDSAVASIQDLEIQLKRTAEKLTQLDQKLHEVNSDQQSTLLSLQTKEAENIELRRVADSTKKKNEKLQTGICSLVENLQKRESEQQAILLSLKEKDAESTELRNIASSVQEQNANLQIGISRLEKEFQKQASEQQMTLLTLKEQETETSELRKIAISAQTQNANLQSSISGLDVKLQKQESEQKTILSELKEKETENTGLRMAAESTQQQNQELQTGISALEEKLQEQESEQKTILSALKDKETENAGLSMVAESAQQQNQELQTGISALEEKLQEQESEQKTMLSSLKDKETELLALLYSLKEKLHANTELRKIATSTQEQFEKMQTEVCTLEEELRKQALKQQTTLLALKEKEIELGQAKLQLTDEWYANIHGTHALQEIYKSISWRTTAPLRFVGGLVIATAQLTSSIWQKLKLKLRSFSINKNVAVTTDINTSAKEVIESKAFQVNEEEHQVTVAPGTNCENNPSVAVASQEQESSKGKDGMIAPLETGTEELTAETHSDLSNNSSYLSPRAKQTLHMLKVTEKKYSEKN